MVVVHEQRPSSKPLEECGHIERLVLERESETVREFRGGCLVYPHLVIVIDLAVIVQVFVLRVTGHQRIEGGERGLVRRVPDVLVVLEIPVEDIHLHAVDGMTFLVLIIIFIRRLVHEFYLIVRIGQRSSQGKDQPIGESLVIVQRGIDSAVVNLADVTPRRDAGKAE